MTSGPIQVPPSVPSFLVSIRLLYRMNGLSRRDAFHQSGPFIYVEADGARLDGWKGGEYLMTRENGLWLAHVGECPGIGIEKMQDTKYHFVLHGKITSDC